MQSLMMNGRINIIMAIPILFFYGIGFILAIIAFYESEYPNNMIFTMLSLFANTIAYYMSYTNNDYLQIAYFPLVLAITSVLMLLYRAWMSIPTEVDWGDNDDNESFN